MLCAVQHTAAPLVSGPLTNASYVWKTIERVDHVGQESTAVSVGDSSTQTFTIQAGHRLLVVYGGTTREKRH